MNLLPPARDATERRGVSDHRLEARAHRREVRATVVELGGTRSAVDIGPPHAPRRHSTADAARLVEHCHVEAGTLKPGGAGGTRDTCTNDGDSG